MQNIPKDSPEVMSFLAIFHRLKDWCDDVPEELIELSISDSSIKNLCIELEAAASPFEVSEYNTESCFAERVNPTFIDAWRDYENRYQSVIGHIWLSDLCPEMFENMTFQIPPNEVGWNWKNADDEANERAQTINDLIAFASDQADQDWRWDEDFSEKLQDGISEWHSLKRTTGFDLRGVFRRRRLIPFVLVPRAVANKHISSDRSLLFQNLQQAHDAFVFGASHATISLLRSVLEGVLRDHYRAVGENLGQRIDSVADQLPLKANRAALHRLRRFANSILHINEEQHRRRSEWDEQRCEIETVRFLLVLRALIEGVR